jgi:heat shock protein HspQ
VRPDKDQPFYHLLAENGENSYVAYVSQQNLVTDSEAGPVDHPSVTEMFEAFRDGRYRLRRKLSH